MAGSVLFPRPWHEVTVNGNPGVVAPRYAASEIAPGAVDGYWLPTEAWLTEAEDAIVVEAEKIPDEDRRPVIDGYRQYAGYIENGERKIAINSLCNVGPDNWKSQAVFVEDGGPCFWWALYNVDTGDVETISVNGVA